MRKIGWCSRRSDPTGVVARQTAAHPHERREHAESRPPDATRSCLDQAARTRLYKPLREA